MPTAHRLFSNNCFKHLFEFKIGAFRRRCQASLLSPRFGPCWPQFAPFCTQKSVRFEFVFVPSKV